MGPYDTQELAAEALITSKGLPAPDAYVWPETREQTRKYNRSKQEYEKKEFHRCCTSPLYEGLAQECERRGMKMPRRVK